MKLITKAIARKLYKADQDFVNSGIENHNIIVKFFQPWGSAQWHITQGTPLDAINGEPCEPENAKDWHLFGLCDLGMGFPELGYVLLSQLQGIHGQFGLRIERDMYFGNHTIKEVQA